MHFLLTTGVQHAQCKGGSSTVDPCRTLRRMSLSKLDVEAVVLTASPVPDPSMHLYMHRMVGIAGSRMRIQRDVIGVEARDARRPSSEYLALVAQMGNTSTHHAFPWSNVRPPNDPVSRNADRANDHCCRALISSDSATAVAAPKETGFGEHPLPSASTSVTSDLRVRSQERRCLRIGPRLDSSLSLKILAFCKSRRAPSFPDRRLA